MVLVIDDDDTIHDLVKLILDDEFRIVTATEPIPGGLLAYTEQPDVILLDLGLPGFGGWDVYSALRDNAKTKDVPVIVMTARPGHEHSDRALENGCAFLKKPLNQRELLATVREATTTV